MWVLQLNEQHSAYITHDVPDGVVSLAEARRRRKLANARKSEAVADELQGKPVRKDIIVAARFSFARTVRDGILNIPERVSAAVAADLMALIERTFPELTMSKLDASDITRLVNAAWTAESRDILEHIADFQRKESCADILRQMLNVLEGPG